MEKIKVFFETNGYPEKVELLPYHAMGEHKYAALNMKSESFVVPEFDIDEVLEYHEEMYTDQPIGV